MTMSGVRFAIFCKACGNPVDSVASKLEGGVLQCDACGIADEAENVLAAVGYQAQQAFRQHVRGPAILVDDPADPNHSRSKRFRVQVHLEGEPA